MNSKVDLTEEKIDLYEHLIDNDQKNNKKNLI